MHTTIVPLGNALGANELGKSVGMGSPLRTIV